MENIKINRRQAFCLFLASLGTATWHYDFVTPLAKTFFSKLSNSRINIDYLGQPCRAKQIFAGKLCPIKSLTQDCFLLTNRNEITGLQLILLDPQKNIGEIFVSPKGIGAWSLIEVPEFRFVMGTFSDGQFVVFDGQKMEFIQTIDVADESIIWNLAMGIDGRVYGGTYPGGKLVALNLENYTVANCGAPSSPNLYLRYVSSTPNGDILCWFGMEKPTTLIYNIKNQTFIPVPKPLEGVQRGVTWNNYFLTGSLVFSQDLELLDEPPFPVPPADKGVWRVDTDITTNEILFLRQGHTIYSYKPLDSSLKVISDLNLHGGVLLAANEQGNVFGVRGQEYFFLKAQSNIIDLKSIPVESPPLPTSFLKVDNQGRLWGGSSAHTLFWIDPKTNQVTNTNQVSDHPGKVYDIAFSNEKIYAVSYVEGEIIEYDTEKFWDQWHKKNPRTIAKVSPAYIRPVGGIVKSKDGVLYSGWMAKYGVYGGAIAITNPSTGLTELIENPLGQQTISGLALDDSFAYVGTSINANGLPDKPGEWAKFGIIDLLSRQVIFSHTFNQIKQIRNISYDSYTRRIVMEGQGEIKIFDSIKKNFLDLAIAAPYVTNASLSNVIQSRVYYGNNNVLWVLDMATLKNYIIEETPYTISKVAASSEGIIYIASGADIYRLTL